MFYSRFRGGYCAFVPVYLGQADTVEVDLPF